MTTNQISQPLPPPDPPGIRKWLRDNLFNGWFNSILTVISGIITFFLLYNAIVWATTQADWRPVTEFPVLYAVGQFPRAELWRVGAGLLIFNLLLGFSWDKWGGLVQNVSIITAGFMGLIAVLPVSHPALTISMRIFFGSGVLVLLFGKWLGSVLNLKSGTIMILWLISPAPVLILLSGFEGSSFLPQVNTTSWGGLIITFLLAIGGIVLSFPIGVLLALGRRSDLPVVKAFCIFFIETIRGVPLITILFMFSIILALFLPQDARLDRVLRALMAMTVFSSAYMAENIRGGLQAVPKGQIEAAKAIGMNNLMITVFIVLPQAIRVVIPAIVGQFISLFKDTTLVVIVGINDLLGIGRSIINSSPEFVQLQTEVYIFMTIIYWLFSYLMSIASRRVEAALGVGDR
ncbi:MAG: ABC transporter permease subunit [Aliifodinibius sp.]|nr:ABC transporter permease subunit [Fodinibius sp.]